VEAARAKAGADKAFLIGDSTWDCEAAKRAGVPTFALLTGGFSSEELRAAEAVAVFGSIPDLIDDLDRLLDAV
jgi:phosphoglycolate phosphatase-like HAD superfamily hydrolase